MIKINLPDIPTPLFSTDIDIRIYDINYGKHVGHDSFVSILHEARVRFLKNFGWSEENIDGVGLVMKNLTVSYLSQVFYGDTVTVKIAIGECSRTSFEIYYQMETLPDKKIALKAITTMTCYDYQQNKVVKIPEEFKTRCC